MAMSQLKAELAALQVQRDAEFATLQATAEALAATKDALNKTQDAYSSLLTAYNAVAAPANAPTAGAHAASKAPAARTPKAQAATPAAKGKKRGRQAAPTEASAAGSGEAAAPAAAPRSTPKPRKQARRSGDGTPKPNTPKTKKPTPSAAQKAMEEHSVAVLEAVQLLTVGGEQGASKKRIATALEQAGAAVPAAALKECLAKHEREGLLYLEGGEYHTAV